MSINGSGVAVNALLLQFTADGLQMAPESLQRFLGLFWRMTVELFLSHVDAISVPTASVSGGGSRHSKPTNFFD
eukprot:scaffold7351_cov90-Skeletonema_dohrnii-CCMP3373.AAC.2